MPIGHPHPSPICRHSEQSVMQAQKAGEMGDTEFLRLAAEEAEFKRVKERLTLKHKNTSQWARRALRRGINVMDEGTAHFCPFDSQTCRLWP